MAGLSAFKPLLIKYCLNNAHAPATAGAEWLVPVEVV